MRKTKKLLALLLLGTACAGLAAVAGCSKGRGDKDNGDTGDTDITDTDTPLGGSECKHEKAAHTAAKASDCKSVGNKEYWYCGDCGKYYADAQFATETTLAAVTLGIGGHTYGDWVAESPASCTVNGTVGHKDCTVCNKHFDAQNVEITAANLVIAAAHKYSDTFTVDTAATCAVKGSKSKHCTADGCDAKVEVTEIPVDSTAHTYGELVAAVTPTSCLTNGTIAHYHCACDNYFDADKNLILFGAAGLVYAPDPSLHNLTHYEALAATCTASGYGESWDCDVCERSFADEHALEEIEIGEIEEALGHNFGSKIEAAAATCAATGVVAHYHCDRCGNDFASNTDEYSEDSLDSVTVPVDSTAHAYGEFVYDYAEKQYKKVCGNNGEHAVTQDAGTKEYPYLAKDEATLTAAVALGGYIKLTGDIISDSSVAVDKAVNIDLGNHTLSAQGVNAFEISGSGALEISGEEGNNVNAGGRVFNMTGAASLTLNGVKVTGNSQGIVSTASGTINVRGCEIETASFPIYVIPGSLGYVYDGHPVYVPVVNVEGTAVKTTAFVGLWVVATELNMTDSNVTLGSAAKASACVFTLGGTVATLTNCTLTNRVGSGLMGNGTLIGKGGNVGENVAVTLNNCTVTGGECALYLPQSNGITTVNGGTYKADATDPETTKSAIEIRGGKLVIDGAELICVRDNYKRVANNNGSTVYGAALAVSQHTTNQDVEAEVKNAKLTGVYAVYEWDQDTTASDKIAVTLGEGNTYNGCVHTENCANLAAVAAGSHKYVEGACACGETVTVVSTAAELAAALANGGAIKLADDIDLTAAESDTNYYKLSSDTLIDLNGNTLTTNKGIQSGEKGNTAAPLVTVVNGTAIRKGTVNKATLTAVGYGRLWVYNCNITSENTTAISIFDQAKATVYESNLKGSYQAFSSNAGTGNYSKNIYAKLVNCTLDADYAALMWNIPSVLVVEGCTVTGLAQAAIIRGGYVEMSDTTLTKRAQTDGDHQRAIDLTVNGYYDKYEDDTWGSGTSVPAYALVVGNRSGSYQYATDLTLKNVTVAVEEGVPESAKNKYVYAYGNTNGTAGEKAHGATITYDAKCNLGNVVIGDKDLEGGSTVAVNAPEAV